MSIEKSPDSSMLMMLSSISLCQRPERSIALEPFASAHPTSAGPHPRQVMAVARTSD